MAAGQRKYDLKEIRIKKEGTDLTADVEYSWGIEEAGGLVLERRGNTTTFSKAELIALLSAPQRQALADVFAALKTAVKVKAAELATAIEE